jgi:hypothetical protein
VAALREKQFGPIPGSVSAAAQFATSTPTGKFVASSFPIIELVARSGGPHKAQDLAWGTFVAFKRWLVNNQDATNVPKAQRITVTTLVAPKGAARTTHNHNGLAVVVFFAVLAGAVFLVIVLDKVVPRRAPKPKPAATAKEGEKEQIASPPGPAVIVPPEI